MPRARGLELAYLVTEAAIKSGLIDSSTPLRVLARLISQALDGVLR